MRLVDQVSVDWTSEADCIASLFRLQHSVGSMIKQILALAVFTADSSSGRRDAGIAQLVEQRIRNA